MSFRSLPLLLLCAVAAPALAQQTPRELNTLPGTPRPAPTPPATVSPAAAPAPAAVAPADTARRAPRALAAPPAVPDSVRRQAQAQAQLPPANTTRYAVGLKNGQVLRGYDVELKQPLLGRTFVLVDGQQRLDLNDVRYYEDETGFYVRTTLPGRSKRESTLRRDRVGRISLYSITSQQYMNNPYGYSPYGVGRYGYGYPYGGYGGFGGYRTVRQEYFSKDNGPIQDLSIRNLQLATTDNPGAQQLLANARRYQRITTLSYIGAGGLMLAGVLSSFNGSNNGFSVSPLMYAAIPLAVVPLVIGGKQQNNIRQAVLLYNRGQ